MFFFPNLSFDRHPLRYLTLLTGVILLSVVMPGKAQDVPKWTFNASYWGNSLWNPGTSVGLEYTHRVQSKTNRRGEDFWAQQFFSLDVGVYVDPGSHTGLLTQAGYHWRRVRPGKLYFSAGVSPLGVFRSFLPETYAVADNGAVSRVTLPGRFYYAPAASVGMGKAWRQHPLGGWFVGLDLIGLLPYNTYAMLLVNVRLGVRFQLNAPKQ